jgi:hypothetical protein
LSLLRIPIVITRVEKGEWQEDGSFTEGVTTPINVKGSIQPYSPNNSQVVLPEGIRASDAVTIWTKTLIRTANQFSKTLADTTVIDGQEYLAIDVANWARHGLRLDHYEVVFIRKDLPTNGGL